MKKRIDLHCTECKVKTKPNFRNKVTQSVKVSLNRILSVERVYDSEGEGFAICIYTMYASLFTCEEELDHTYHSLHRRKKGMVHPDHTHLMAAARAVVYIDHDPYGMALQH